MDWSKKRILVTGGAGFLGRHLVRKLQQKGSPYIFIPRKIQYDLREKTAIRTVLDLSKPDLIFHLAAIVGGIGANRSLPATFFYDNIIMGVQLMEEARRAGISKFVTVGTVCAYPKFTHVPFREEDLWNGYPEETNAPYGLAKKMLLVQAQAYFLQHGFQAIYLLPTNLYGPGDKFDQETSHVIPGIIGKCLEAVRTGKKEIVLWGDGSPTREFLYVEDAVDGLILAAEKVNRPEPINLGSGFEISIRDLAEMIAEYTGFSGRFVWDTRMPNGQPRRLLDTTRAEKEFGFKARTSFAEGLQRTIQWYREQG